MNENIINSLYDKDFLVRCDAIEYLSDYFNDSYVVKEILNMFNDKNYLVRCEAYDAFYNYTSENILDVLIKALKKERSKCAKMHLCSTICSIVKVHGYTDKLVEIVNRLYETENADNVKIAYCCIMYLFDRNVEYINKVLGYINNNDYHIRCNVINLLWDIIDSQNCDNIIKVYKNQLIKETSFAVKDLLQKSLYELEKIYY